MAALTQAQTQKIAEALNYRYSQLVGEIKEELKHTGEGAAQEFHDGVPDEGDQSVAGMFADLNATMMDRQLDEIERIDVARARLREGEINVCDECGCEIPFERLLVEPTATRCVPCQEQYEKTHAGRESPSL